MAQVTSKASTRKTRQAKLNIVADAAVARGAYANLTSCTLGAQEVTLDFIYQEPQRVEDGGDVAGHLVARVIVAGSHLRPLVELLERQLKVLEAGERNAKKTK